MKVLQDKVILITGASGGIGSAAVKLFAAEGAKLAIAGRTIEKVAAIVADTKAQGAEAIAVSADLSKPKEIEGMINKVVEHFGKLDGAFNNAGLGTGAVNQSGNKTADWEVDAFEKMINVNLMGTWYCMKAELKQMQRQGNGAIVNTSSLAGIAGFNGTAGYSASKHAIIGLTKTAALEYAPNIRVNAICPGYADTPLIANGMEKNGDAILSKIPFGRLANPIEIAQAACWLLSNKASYSTGTTMVADGGYMAG